jgi:hypothetical protein
MIEVTIIWPLDLSRTMHYVFGTRKKIHVPTLLTTIWIQLREDYSVAMAKYYIFISDRH